MVRGLKLLNQIVMDMDASPGELIFIKGANGTGKSLLLKTLARLLPASHAELKLNGKPATDYPAADWRSKVMYLPPEVSFEDEHTVRDFLELPLQFKIRQGFTPKFEAAKFLNDLSSPVRLLSSGQKQKLAFLRALSLDPEVLLLDESFSHMDTATREEMMQLLVTWMKPHKLVLLITHFDLGAKFISSREITL